MIDHLAGDRVHMGSVLGGPDAVHKGHGELLVGRAVGNGNVPALVGRLIHHRLAPKPLGVLGNVLALDGCPVPRDLGVLAQRHCQVVDTALNQGLHVGANVLHAEARKVGRPRYAHVGLVLALLRGGCANVRHVVLEGLSVQQSARLVHHRHNHLLRKDVGQLDAVAVLATHELLLVLVVVGGRQQLPEYHLGNPDLVLGVLRDINGLSVILNGKGCGRAGDLNGLDGVLGVLLAQSDGVVVSIHQQLIHQLVEAWVHGNGGGLEVVSIANKHILRASHNAAHVGVGKVEDVLAVRLALVGRESHGEIRFNGPQSFRF